MKIFPWCVALWIAASAGGAEVRWADGTVAPAPAGALLSDNPGFYGDVEWTGVTYEYAMPPRPGSGDASDDSDKSRGRRLLNGELGDSNGGWRDLNAPLVASPAAITFDLQRVCEVVEADLHLPEAGSYHIAILDADTETPLAARDVTVERPEQLVRLPDLTAQVRRLRIEITRADNADFRCSEVYLWGKRGADPAEAEGTKAVYYDATFSASISGIANTQIDDGVYKRWMRELKKRFPVVPELLWSQLPIWEALSRQPILPAADSVNPAVTVTLATNETEAVALALTNTDYLAPVSTEVTLGAFTDASGQVAPGITGELMVLGALPGRDFGVQLVPLLSVANKPGAEVIARYCTNGAMLRDFPKLALHGGGSAVCWVRIHTAGALPGQYQARLQAGDAVMTLTAQVVDITLEDADRWVNFWQKPFAQFPFQSLDWVENDADHRLALGINVAQHAPDDNPASLNNVLRRKNPDMMFALWQGTYGGKLWARGHMNDNWGENGLTPEDVAAIRAEALGVANYAKSRGLNFNQWYFDTADEPNTRNFPVTGEVLRVIKEAVPEAMIFCNPCCWQPDPKQPFEPDERIMATMMPWYNEVVDISVPASSLLDYEQAGKVFTSPRRYRAHYEVVTQRAKSESYDNVNYPRRMVWEALAREMNGWALFSYFNVSGSEPWDDLQGEGGSFTLVFPGPAGPVPTRQYEAAREAYEEYRLMTQLKRDNPAAFAEIIAAYRDGELYEELREMIYQAFRQDAGLTQ